MEKYILNIEYINNYINKLLSETERREFINSLQKDADFNNLYEEHLTFLEGLKRVKIKEEIKSAHKSYVKTKWIKYGAISVAVIVASIIIYSIFTSKPGVQKEQIPSIENITVPVSDSIADCKPSEIQFKAIDTPKIEVKENLNRAKEEKTNKPVNKSIVEKERIEEISEDTVKQVLTVISKDKPIATKSTIDYTSFKKAPQEYIVDAEQEVTVTCDEGTKLTIKKHSFTDPVTNNLVRGKVDLKVTEYYKLSDMVLGDLTTTSDGELLETGGMLFIDVYKNNRKLRLKPNNPITISFPKKGNKKGMQLFNGEKTTEGINWILNENEDIDDLLGEVTSAEIIEEDIEVPFYVVENVPVYPGCENGTNQRRKDCMSRNIQEFVKRNFNTNLLADLGLNGRQRINAVFKIDKQGLISEIRTRAQHQLLEIEVERVLKLLPPMKPGMQRGKPVIVPYSLPIIFRIDDGNTNITTGSFNDPKNQKTIDSIIQRVKTKIENDSPSNISNSELNWYVFRSLELGWINCDRFVRSGKPKTKLKIKIKDSKGSDVKLVFKSMNSLLRGRKYDEFYDFGSVPKDEDVVLIAIKKSEDKFYLVIQDGKTDTISDFELDFKEMTIQELKAEIEKLNFRF